MYHSKLSLSRNLPVQCVDGWVSGFNVFNVRINIHGFRSRQHLFAVNCLSNSIGFQKLICNLRKVGVFRT